MKSLALIFYYGLAVRFPTQPFPGWRFGYWLRRLLMRLIADNCGDSIIIKQNAYVGSGVGLSIGSNSQIGANSHIGPYVTIGNDVVMGPDVVIMTTAHAFEDPSIPVRLQGSLPIRPVIIADDVWIGTRAVILPGIEIGKGAIIGAGSVVTRNVAPYAIVGGNPAGVIRMRGDRLEV